MDFARTPQTTRVFIDSSVVIAAAISSRGSARELIIHGIAGRFTLILSEVVLVETERNLLRKAPGAFPAFELLRAALGAELADPSKALVLRVAKVIELKDAPIVAAAIRAKADYLATYDRRHLLSRKDEIQDSFQVAVATPDEVLRQEKKEGR